MEERGRKEVGSSSWTDAIIKSGYEQFWKERDIETINLRRITPCTISTVVPDLRYSTLFTLSLRISISFPLLFRVEFLYISLGSYLHIIFLSSIFVFDKQSNSNCERWRSFSSTFSSSRVYYFLNLEISIGNVQFVERDRDLYWDTKTLLLMRDRGAGKCK